MPEARALSLALLGCGSAGRRHAAACVKRGVQIRWVIDLHGLSDERLESHQLVDLGTRKERQSLPREQREELRELIEARVGRGTVHCDFSLPASRTGPSPPMPMARLACMPSRWR